MQALAILRQLLGYDSVPRDFDVSGKLAYEPQQLDLDELQARALTLRPDLQAVQGGVNAANSQVALAKANGKQDPSLAIDYTHVNSSNFAAVYFNVPLPIFNRNQGEILRTKHTLTQSQMLEEAAKQQVKTAYEDLLNSEEEVKLYEQGYLQLAQESLEIMQSSYQEGTVSLIDFLDARRSYRETELSYRQALSTKAHLSAAAGTRWFIAPGTLKRGCGRINRSGRPKKGYGDERHESSHAGTVGTCWLSPARPGSRRLHPLCGLLGRDNFLHQRGCLLPPLCVESKHNHARQTTRPFRDRSRKQAPTPGRDGRTREVQCRDCAL